MTGKELEPLRKWLAVLLLLELVGEASNDPSTGDSLDATPSGGGGGVTQLLEIICQYLTECQPTVAGANSTPTRLPNLGRGKDG